MDCPTCDGTGWRRCQVDGVARVRRCECRRKRLIAELVAAAGIPRHYAACDFAGFVRYDNPYLERALTLTRSFIDDFPSPARGLLLLGPSGVGKTHIAVAALREIVVTHAVPAVYFDTRTLLATLRASFNPPAGGTAAAVLERVLGAALLVLDDLGAERPTEWVLETMSVVLNTRYSENRPTILTSNYEDLSDRGDPDSLCARVGARSYSRLREMCEFLEYSGPDYREYEFPPAAADLAHHYRADPRRSMRRSAERSVRFPKAVGSRARASLPERVSGELGWSGGRAGS